MDAILISFMLAFVVLNCLSIYLAMEANKSLQATLHDIRTTMIFKSGEIANAVSQANDSGVNKWTMQMFEKLTEAMAVERLGRDVTGFVQQKRLDRRESTQPPPSPVPAPPVWPPPGAKGVLRSEN